ncbi:MAG: CapA family protein, partial [Actinomycetota bacterium]
MRFKLALAGDTMLGRGVAKELRTRSPKSLFSEEVVEALGEADAFVLNLECCISERGTHWSAPGKPFFFRAPPAAVEALQHLGVDCVTLANNHALDFSEPALLDTFDHLEAARIAWVGAGTDVQRARAPARLRVNGSSLTIVACSDHPDDFAAGEGQPGIAYADLSARLPQWLRRAVHAEEASLVLVMAHWGPNMVTTPRPYIRDASTALVDAGATLVAGHSAHVFH